MRGAISDSRSGFVISPVVEFFVVEGESRNSLSVSGPRIRIFFKHSRVKKGRDQIKCVFYDTENLLVAS
ncbi:hypothetical protein BIW11_03590 [Tropilaelaps mercedesae]|uniref:Uncharacterized protein n=1 Tax=Tropilaelaps mercedesae TaxID=418985 RepID=A0A1V9XIW1_9ACAR|nr:hypothetical protein BIW11_03590 [Tropilaelaps mercedesae]